MNPALAIARRELRGGPAGFRVFLACIILGVAAIAIVGSVREAIRQGLVAEATAILGGDAQAEFTYRLASPEELEWMQARSEAVSETIQFRSMAASGDDRVLVQVKAVDRLYPLYGNVGLDPPMPLAKALAGNGFVAERSLADRLGLQPGDSIALGNNRLTLRAILTAEPDNTSAGFSFGPKVILLTTSLQGSGLLEPGALFNAAYRMKLPPTARLPRLKLDAEAAFGGTGLRWTDRRNAAPGIARFVQRMGSFLVLAGLAGLAVGGAGIAAAVHSYLQRKSDTIATLKTLGATSGTIFGAYLSIIGLLGSTGVVAGLALGAAVPLLLGPLLAGRLPVPAMFAVYPAPLAEAALYGVLATLAFSLWPLARARDIKAGELFRNQIAPGRRFPGWPFVAGTVLLLALLVAAAAWLSGMAALSLWFAAGIAAATALLRLAAFATRKLAARLARAPGRQPPALRLALGAAGGPAGETAPVILSLGLGLTVLAAIGQIDANLQRALSRELPAVAPAFFVLDIQTSQIGGFLDLAESQTGVTGIETAPMLRGIITGINGRPAREVAGSHWTLDGDRGITFSAAIPAGTILTAGSWWPEGYQGPPLVSFAAEEAAELGLKLGDSITVNVLGRDISAEIASLRAVEFRDMGINFILVMSPEPLQSAPHTHIATIYARQSAEGLLQRRVAAAFANITLVPVREAIAAAAGNLAELASATRWGTATTVLTGLIVLVGAAAAGERQRVQEAAILKSLGAGRSTILASFALRAAILGTAAGLVAVLAATAGAWAIVTFQMQAEFRFHPESALAIVFSGAAASLLAGLAFAWRPLSAPPARVLRARD